MTLKAWLLFLIMETTLSLSPGPAVFYVVAQGMRGGLRRGVSAASGIIMANAIYFALSATSLGALIAASVRFFTVIKWAGALYLVYLGVMALWSSRHNVRVELSGNDALRPDNHRHSVFTGALTLQLANPKALLFFVALLPQFVDPHSNVPLQMTILAATSMLPEFFILLGYAWLAHRAASASTRLGVTSNMHHWLARVEGVALLSCAAMVLKFSHGV
ncbi:MAG TPA: LysE family translocator [Steroidobacteraceae bacterium]|nr:LysE family translocator [Steroidobacteraceae bacterium]